MSRPDDFKGLAQDITSSFDERMTVLASIKREVHELSDNVHRMLDDLHRERSEMTSQLRKDLTKATSSIKKGTGQLLKGFRKEHQDAVAVWGHLGDTMRAKRAGGARKAAK